MLTAEVWFYEGHFSALFLTQGCSYGVKCSQQTKVHLVCLSTFLTHLCVLCSCITVLMKQAFLQNQDPLKAVAFNWPYYTNKHEFLCTPILKRDENSSSSFLCSFCHRSILHFLLCMWTCLWFCKAFAWVTFERLFKAKGFRYLTCHIFCSFVPYWAPIKVIEIFLYNHWSLCYNDKHLRFGAVLKT